MVNEFNLGDNSVLLDWRCNYIITQYHGPRIRWKLRTCFARMKESSLTKKQIYDCSRSKLITPYIFQKLSNRSTITQYRAWFPLKWCARLNNSREKSFFCHVLSCYCCKQLPSRYRFTFFSSFTRIDQWAKSKYAIQRNLHVAIYKIWYFYFYFYSNPLYKLKDLIVGYS